MKKPYERPSVRPLDPEDPRAKALREELENRPPPREPRFPGLFTVLALCAMLAAVCWWLVKHSP